MSDMASQRRDAHATSIKELLSSGKFSDLTITCGPDTHQVHRAVVCTRCGFFERAERFAVGKEAAENKIDLPEDEPDTISLLVEYLYTSEYVPHLPQSPCASCDVDPLARIPEMWRNVVWPHTCAGRCSRLICTHHTCDVDCDHDCVDMICDDHCPEPQPAAPEGDSSQLLVHSKMYTIGDKYDVPGLKELAREKFCRACKMIDFDKSSDFVLAAEHAYTTTMEEDHGLRTIVRDTMAGKKEIVAGDDVKELLENQPKLMYELLIKAMR